MKHLDRTVGALALLTALAGCGSMGTGNGEVSLYLTDSPVMAQDVAAVYITINSIEYQLTQSGEGGEWELMEEFTGPQEFNLLDLQGGTSALLGQLTLPAGTIGQIRFFLDAPDVSGGAPSNPGSYVQLTDDTTIPLFVPSASQSGFKATGAFDVPVNGSVEITADFDVRKSIVARGGQGGGQTSYILKPTIRLVVNNQAGDIVVTMANTSPYPSLAIFAYEDGAYMEDQAVVPDPLDTEADPQFSGAATSAVAGDDGNYRLAYLAAGTYDLVVAGYWNDGAFGEVLHVQENVTVTADQNAAVSIALP